MRFFNLLAGTFAVAVASMSGALAQVSVEKGMTSDSHCGEGYCFTALYKPSDKMLNYTLVVPQGNMQIGWWGVAQGTRMVGANMAVNWVNADMSLTTSHRSARSQVQPMTSYVTVQSFSTNADISRTSAGQTVWSWNMPLPSGDPQNAVNHVVSVSPTSPQSADPGATIVKHNRHDLGITLDLTKAYTGAAPAGIAGSTQSVSSTGTTGGGQRDTGNSTTRIYIVHMVFMIVGWQLCFPIGILLARFGRTKFTWFPAHRAVQSVGALFVFIGFFLAVGAVAMQGIGHFATTHQKLGLALFILLLVQVALGVAAHSVKQRTGKRVIGFLHWPIGLLLYGLSVWNIHEGFEVWQWQPPAYASYIIYAWAALMFVLYVGGMALLPKERRLAKEQNDVQKHELSSDENQQRY